MPSKKSEALSRSSRSAQAMCLPNANKGSKKSTPCRMRIYFSGHKEAGLIRGEGGTRVWEQPGILLALAGPGSAQTDTANAPYDVIIAKNVMVPMRDGVKLATDIYMPGRTERPRRGNSPCWSPARPTARRPEPALRRGTPRATLPNSATSSSSRIPRPLQLRGTFYIDVNEGHGRLRHGGMGARQPWSNGKVGTYGGSYLARCRTPWRFCGLRISPPCSSWSAPPIISTKALTAAERSPCCTISFIP